MVPPKPACNRTTRAYAAANRAAGSRIVSARLWNPSSAGGEIDMMEAPAPRTTMAILGPYYYGKHKWDNYLLDIQGTIESGNTAQRESIELQHKALNVAHGQLAELREQTEQFRHIGQALEIGFEELRAEFQWGFASMLDRMDMQINLLSNVAAELDAIHQTLKSPLINQAQELFRLGEEHYNESLFDRALEKFLESEKKNEVHPLLQFRIGMLYLYPHGDGYDLIDMPQAETHFLLAARYADAKKKTLSRWNELSGQAYFHAAVGAYFIGEQEQAAGRPDSMRACLERGLGYLAKAVTIWPQFTEIVYHQAKCHALLGQVRDAEQKLEILSDRDRRYFAKASQDGDFQTFHASVEELFRRAIHSPGPLARATQAKLDEVAEAIAWAKRSAPTSKEDLAAIKSIELDELPDARRSLPTLDVDIEDLSERLSRARAVLDKIAERSFQNNVDAAERSVASLEQRKTGYESSIQKLSQTIDGASGTGLGCFFFFLFPAVTVLSFNVIFGPKPADTIVAVGVLATVLSPVVGFLLGRTVSRDRQNRPNKLKIEEDSLAVAECIRELPALRERAEAGKRELGNFAAWQAQRPSPPQKPTSAHRGGSLTVTIISPGANKINVIKAIREVTGFELREAKDLLDNAPQPVKRGVTREEAEAIARKLSDAGASVRIE